VFLKGLGFHEIMVFQYTHACGNSKKKKKRVPSGGAAGGLNKLYSLLTLIPSSCWRKRVTKNVGEHALHGL
jgi:hypothetical protein